jgi:hypothetical protein
MTTDSHSLSCSDLLRYAVIHDRHQRALEKATGENFNLFKILGIGHLEVKTHSPLLGELLDRHGSHGQGGVFLKRFLELQEIKGFSVETSQLRLEHYVGPVDGENGGRIDIWIDDGQGSTILIENKIYAGDQPDQLKRYRKKFPKAHLFYLTLDGTGPSNVSEEETNELKFTCISYGKEILEWLEACKKEATSLPGVRETIAHYIHLIGDLTGCSISKSMSEDLVEEILNKPENLSALYSLRETVSQVERKLIFGLDRSLTKMAEQFGLKREKALENLDRKDSEFSFRLPSLDARNLQISFYFENRNYQNFCFGFSRIKNGIEVTDKEEICIAFTEQFGCDIPNEWWPAWSYFEAPYRYWGPDAFMGIHTGHFLAKLEDKVKTMVAIANRRPILQINLLDEGSRGKSDPVLL